MKHFSILLIGIMLSIFIACGNNSSFITGKWTICGTGLADTTNANDKLFSSIPFSDGAEFVFENDGSFDLANNGKKIISGNYVVSEDQKALTLKANNNDYVYEITKGENDVTLTSVKNKSIIKMKK